MNPRNDNLDARQVARIHDAVAILKADYKSEWTAQRLAAAVNLTPDALTQGFQQLQGCSLRQKLIELRLEAAMPLLLDGKLATHVSKECGFSSVETFSRHFVAKTGIYPSHYRYKMRLRAAKVRLCIAATSWIPLLPDLAAL